MAGDLKPNPSFDLSVLDQLACPACFGDLCLRGEKLACNGCGLLYPLVGGIPVLIAERAVDPSQCVSSATSSTTSPTMRTE